MSPVSDLEQIQEHARNARRYYHRALACAVVSVSLALGALTLAFTGCEQFGPRPDIDSTADAILEAKANAKAYALLVTDLLELQVITPSQAREQLEHLRTVETELQRATAVLDATGDPFAAGTRLERTDRALALVLGFLTEHMGGGDGD